MLNEINDIDHEVESGDLLGGQEVTANACFSQDYDCNLYIGDNALVLSKLNVELNGKINFCYIDPPYNTKNKFIYDDRRVSERCDIWGSHKEWMLFMRPRLELAQSLLAKNGIIAVSIDDYEQPYLRVLLDQIFGEENFIGCITVCRSNNGKGARDNIATNHEYIVVYGKSKYSKVRGIPDSDISSYDKLDRYGAYRIDGLFRKKGDASLREERPNLFYPLYYDNDGSVYTEKKHKNLKEVFPIDSKGVERRWLWGKEKAAAESWRLYASPRGTVYVKNYFDSKKRIKPKSMWVDNRYLTERGTNEIKKIYGNKIFETPKPIELIKDLLDSHASTDSLILDFFAGTGTTAHAAYELNKLDGGDRKVILVEQDAPISETHLAFKHGFRVISDITEWRLKWIQSENNKYKFNIHHLG